MKRKLFILILLMASCVLTAQETSHLLGKKVTITFKESTVADVLKLLESEVEGMVFMYSPSTFNLDRKVSKSFIEKTLKEVLEGVFENLNIEFQEKNNKLLIKPGKAKKGQGGLRSAPHTPVKEEVRINPKRRKLIRPKPQTKEKAIVLQEKESLIIPKVNQMQAAQLMASNDSALEGKFAGPKSTTITRLNNDLALRFQPLPKHSWMGEAQIAEDSTNLSDKRIKRILAKDKRIKERANEPKKFRIYGSSYTGYTKIGDQAGIQLGGSLVWLKNRRWGFGLAGFAIQSAAVRDDQLNGDYRIGGGYGGVLVEYTLNPTHKFHVSFPVMVGGGAIAYKQQDTGLGNPALPIFEDTQLIFVSEIGVIAEMNVIKYLRVGLGLHYRSASDASLAYEGQSTEILGVSGLTGLNFGLTVKFGLF